MWFRLAYGSNVTIDDNPQEPPARPLLDIDTVRARLTADGRTGPIVYLSQCDSTNAQAAALELGQQQASPQWALVVAEEQTAGRGRLSRSWTSKPGTGLLFSVALAATDVPAHLSLIPLLVGLAVAQRCVVQGVPARVKWPNDIIVIDSDGVVGKLGGVLLERTPAMVVAGVGLNVFESPAAQDAPEGAALVDHGLAATQTQGVREVLLADCTAAILDMWDGLKVGEDQALLSAYRDACATLGSAVRATLPDGSQILGEAVDVDDTGRLLVVPESAAGGTVSPGVLALSAADIVHLRSV